MYKLMSNVPLAIAEFFVEETRNELTGKQVEERFTYIDEDEVEQTGTRLVNEYVDNIYVVLRNETQFVSWQQVKELTIRHKGKRDEVVKTFIAMALLTDAWTFYHEYVNWLKECVILNAYNDTEQLDEEGEPIAFTKHELALEPVNVDLGKDKRAWLFNAKLKRDQGQYDFITSGDLLFDADPVSYEKMKGTIFSWDALSTAGAIADNKIMWTLADNTNALLTQLDLEKVIDLIAVRAAVLQSNYEKAKI